MNKASVNQTVLLSIAAILLSSPFLVFAFAEKEWAAFWHDHRVQASVLFLSGIGIVIVFAYFASKVDIEIFPKIQNTWVAVLGGTCTTFIGCLSAWLISSVSIWGLLIWFSVGTFVFTILLRATDKFRSSMN